MEVAEGWKRVEKKVKHKLNCWDDEIICLIEGISNEKKYVDEQATKFGNKQEKGKFGESSRLE